MALKGVIQGAGGQGGQLSGSGVTSVGLVGPAPFITGPPVTSSGNLTFDFSGVAIPVAQGGTGANNFTSNAVVLTGPSSTAPLTSVVLPQQSSEFLNGMGVFSAIPSVAAGAGTVTSVDLSLSSEFRVSGDPITGAGTLVAGFIQPLNVAHGGTAMGSFGPGVIMGGLTSTGPLQGLPLTNLTSTFLRGDGVFGVPPSGGGGGAGTVTSVDIAVPSEFTVSGDPVTTSGTMVIGRISPSSVSAGGTGMGSFGPGLILGGLTSTGPLQGLPFPSLTSNFLAGDGVFRIPVNPGGTVQSVGISMTSEFAVQRTPVLGSGTIDIGFKQPLAVAHGGTGMGSFGPSVVLGGLSSSAPLQGLPLTNLTSTFLAGDGIFRIPVNPGGTVQSVALGLTSEFSVTGSPILGSGTLTIGFKQALAVAHGGTGLGSIGIGAVLRGGLTSTAPMQGTPLTNLTSTFLDGTGNYSVPPSGGGGSGTVTSVGLQLSSEFNVTGSPVTTAGTLMASWAFQSANKVLAGPTGAPSNTPAFRSLVNADIPQSLSGQTLSSITIQNPTLTTQVLPFGSSIKWNMNSGAIALLGMNSTAKGTMDTPANVANTGAAILRVMQLGTGLTNLAWNHFWRFEGGTQPTLSSGFSQVDVISLYMESTAGYGVARKNFS